jgi:hypothetical protein
MEKRFTNPEDLPQLNVAEIRQTAIDMLKILPKVAYDPDPHAWAYDIRRLAQGLTPDQWTLLKEGKRLPLADLSPAQQAAVVGIIRLRAYGMPVSVWEMLRRQLDRFDDSVLRAEKRGVFNEVDGRATAYYDIDHESRGVDGVVTKTPIGTFQRSVKP